MTRFLEHYRAWITPLSPVHIGTGEDYEPTNFVVHDGALWAFDPLHLPFNGQLRNRLRQIVEGEDVVAAIAATHLFFANSFSPQVIDRTSRYRVPVCDGFVANCEEAKKKWQDLQRKGATLKFDVIKTVNVARMMRDPLRFHPYLPGTSVKGALRGLVLRSLARRKGRTVLYETKPREKVEEKFRKLENDLLERGERAHLAWDPLRLLGVSDFHPTRAHAGDAGHVVFRVRMYRKPEFKKGKKKDIIVSEGVEVVLPGKLRPFEGAIILRDLDGHRVPGRRRNDLPKSLSAPELEDLVGTANRLAKRVLTQERNSLIGNTHVNPKWLDAALELLDALEPHNDDGSRGHRAFLLRLGQGSGARYLSLGDPGTKTLSVAGLTAHPDRAALPFGWVLVELAPEGEEPPTFPELEEFCASWGRWAGSNAEGAPSHSGGRSEVKGATRTGIDIEIPNSPHAEQLRAARDQIASQLPERYHALLSNLVKQARNWSSEERSLLVRLVEEHVRPKLGDRAEKDHRWKQILQQVAKLKSRSG